MFDPANPELVVRSSTYMERMIGHDIYSKRASDW